MKKFVLTLSILFIFASFLGGGYVLYMDGLANPGCGLIPLFCTLVCLCWYNALIRRSIKPQKKDDEDNDL